MFPLGLYGFPQGTPVSSYSPETWGNQRATLPVPVVVSFSCTLCGVTQQYDVGHVGFERFEPVRILLARQLIILIIVEIIESYNNNHQHLAMPECHLAPIWNAEHQY